MPTLNPSQLKVADMTGFLDPQVGTRIRHVLLRNGITTLAQLLQYSEKDLLDLRHFGTVSLAQLTIKLKALGFELKRDEVNSW